MTIHDEIKGMRHAAGLSQQAFATQLGVSIRAVANWEAKRVPQGAMKARLFRFAKEHGLTLTLINICECCGRAL